MLLPAVVVVIAALFCAWLVNGVAGLAGMALGLGGTFINLIGWWLLIRLLGADVKEKNAKLSAGCSVFLFFLKLPLILACWFLAKKVGHPAEGPFLIGLGLVYCGMLIAVQTRR